MVDTCQAMTLFDEITSSEVLCIGSSVRAENSYARGVSRLAGTVAFRFDQQAKRLMFLRDVCFSVVILFCTRDYFFLFFCKRRKG